MRKIISFIIVIAIITSGIKAQDFEVKKFYSASKNRNYKNYAQIKIYTGITELDFDCEKGFVFKPEHLPGEYRLCLYEGENIIKISKNSSQKIEYHIKRPVKKAHVYKMILEFKNRIDGILNITTKPPGASVFLNKDKNSAGKTLFKKQVPEGEYKYKIALKGYETETGTIKIKSNRAVKINKILKHSQPKHLAINSIPDKAKLYINGKFAGYTPYSKIYKSGRFKYKITKDLYKDAKGTLELTAENNKSVTITLKPNFGSLLVNTQPEKDAKIFIDGKEITGVVTPYQIKQLSIGNHTIRVSKNDFISDSINVNIKKGKNKEITLNMKPKFSKINISTAPDNVLIKIDGKHVGLGNFSDVLNEGIHTIEMSKKGYYSKTRSITINPGESQTLNYQLEAKTGLISINSTPLKADIYLNDKKQKYKTPHLVRNLPVGEYKLEVRKNGSFAGQMIKVEENKTIQINLNVKKGPTSTVINFTTEIGLTVTVNSRPQGANIHVDGNYKGKAPQILALNFGEHNIKLSGIKKYNDTEHAINITQNGKTEFTLSLRGTAPDNFILVKGASFKMGNKNSDHDEKPVHKVTVSDFYIGKYEVTQKEWKEIMGNNPSEFKGDNLPVENVNWEDIQKFISKLNEKTGNNYRLPTEAEWEYAARGGNKSSGNEYSGTNSKSELYKYANFCDSECNNFWATKNQTDGYNQTAPVGSFTPNELGIYDMSGNVWEWCNDWYNNSYYANSSPTNPQGPENGSRRVNRGGSWAGNISYCRSQSRYNSNPEDRYNYLGFRLVVVP